MVASATILEQVTKKQYRIVSTNVVFFQNKIVRVRVRVRVSLIPQEVQ